MNKNKKIPLSIPNIKGNEWKYVKDCLDTGWISTAGKYVEMFEDEIKNYLNAKYTVSTMNGTSALHIALMINGVKEKDYVILPNVTFVATANSVVYNNANPIFIDVDNDNWQIDIGLLEDFLINYTYMDDNGNCKLKKDNKRIRAIIIVHNQGNICDIERIIEITKNYNIKVIEDAAEALGSTFQNRHAGTFGTVGCLSFNGNKIISTGGGGMIITNSKKLYQKAKHLVTTAKTNPLDYFHDEVGYNYRLVNVLAAIGMGQIEKLNEFVISKRKIAEHYIKKLTNIGDISFQAINSDVYFNYWLFTIRTKKRIGLQKYLISNNIECRPIWTPMNELPMYQNNLYFTKENVSKTLKNQCLNLPCSTNLSKNCTEEVISKIANFFSIENYD